MNQVNGLDLSELSSPLSFYKRNLKITRRHFRINNIQRINDTYGHMIGYFENLSFQSKKEFISELLESFYEDHELIQFLEKKYLPLIREIVFKSI